nr:ribonuclease HII [Caproiciproducens sp. NJN-50]
MVDWHFYENAARRDGLSLVCGIDEAGRGPLAGPVFAAAVIFPPHIRIEGLNDSKKLTPKRREELYGVILQTALAYGIGFASEDEIDKVNILQATFLAMRRAFDRLQLRPDCALVDGNRMPDLGVETRLIVKGDSLSASIAAASILAKVSRDRVMCQIDEIYPGYGFAKHKGYGTSLHREMLRKMGPCPVHRRTFLKKILAGYGNE